MKKTGIFLLFTALLGIPGSLWYADRARCRRFTEAEEHFLSMLDGATECVRQSLLQFEGCTPEQADRVHDALREDGSLALTEEFCAAAERALDLMERDCPRRYIPRLIACSRRYEQINTLAWWPELPFCYRTTPRKFTAYCLGSPGPLSSDNNSNR